MLPAVERLLACSRLLRRLTALAALTGVGSLYWVARPDSPEAWRSAIRLWILPAFDTPLFWGTAVLGTGAWLLAQGLDLPSSNHPAPSAGHSLESADYTSTLGPKSSVGPRLTEVNATQRLRSRIEAHITKSQPDIPGFVDDVLRAAVHAGASDIHIQPLELSTRVTFRLGGELEEVAIAPRAQHQAIIRRLKVLSKLVVYQTDRPQDGRIVLDTPRGRVDSRLSVLPTNHGEKAVLRLARLDDALFRLDRLGLTEPLRQHLEDLLAEPQGVIVLTGPTGSGKTTTLYASLGHIHATRGETTNLATIEDPIEVDLPFLNQTRVQRSRGLSFAEGLRAVLRQDPDVLMVGEIRDRESAQAAIQAGLSGHLILTTLHAESAVGVFPRLIDLGVEPFLASSAILASASQRLARRLCPDCRRVTPPSRTQMQRLTQRGLDAEGLQFHQAPGCDTCEGSGHRGRVALFEMLTMTPEIRQIVTARADTDTLARAAREAGMAPLADDALRLANLGEISLEEALRVAS